MFYIVTHSTRNSELCVCYEVSLLNVTVHIPYVLFLTFHRAVCSGLNLQ